MPECDLPQAAQAFMIGYESEVLLHTTTLAMTTATDQTRHTGSSNSQAGWCLQGQELNLHSR